MARSPDGQSDGLRTTRRSPRDPLNQTLHYLSNNMHSLSLRLFVLQNAKLSPDLGAHVEAAQRLAEQSATLIERLHDLLPVAPPERRRPATRRGR
jgi:hypothetical protein